MKCNHCGHDFRRTAKQRRFRHRLLIGDCTDQAAVEKLLGGEKVDLVVTSPPYLVGKEYELETGIEEHLCLIDGFAEVATQIVKPGGFVFVNFGDVYPQQATKKITGREGPNNYLMARHYYELFVEKRDFSLYASRIWYKPFGRLIQPFWSYHTSIPHHGEWEYLWTFRAPGATGDECYDLDISMYSVWDTRTEDTDDKPLARHVAAFPIYIPKRAIKAHSPVGALVWEPFCGSGTTVIAAEMLGRFCRAVEISPAYAAVTLERWSQFSGESPVILS